MKSRISVLFVVTLLLAAASCRKERGGDDFYPTDSVGIINKWIIDSMRTFYYWNGDIPSSPDYTQSPELFYKSILSKSDRFSSIIYTPSPALDKSSFYKFGFHFAFVQVDGYDGYLGVITFVMANSPASLLEWKRGDCFTKVNGVAVTAQNLAAVTKQIEEAASLQLTMATQENGAWKSHYDISIRGGGLIENPMYYTRTFTSGGKTTGYLFYNYFDELYDDELLEAFGRMRTAGVSELILDLRYNMGGSVASSAKMAALIASGLTATDIYAIFEGNRGMGKRARTLQEILNTSASDAGRTYSALTAARIQVSRVFILTTKATASAAELLINNLRPYMEVIQIGEETTGKDEAGFGIVDLRIPPQIHWELHPIVYKLFNKSGEGHYSDGLQPDIPASEFSSFPLQPVATAADPLIRRALEEIYGANLPDVPVDLRRKQTPAIPVFRSVTSLAEQMPPATVQY